MQNITKHTLASAFPTFETELLEEILSVGIFKEFNENEEIVREGQYIAGFPLVLKGLIRVTKRNDEGNELLLYYLNEKEVCAMSLTCCMSRQISQINAVADQKTETIIVPVEFLDVWLTKYPGWKQFVMHLFQRRFNELVNTIEAIAFMKLDERLIRFFTERYAKTGTALFEGTHQEMAIQMNSSREVISRLLKKLENKGSIKIFRNSIDFSGLL
jgi:CRP/FNR family transcriptional regulator, anaerobic regulatory protein